MASLSVKAESDWSGRQQWSEMFPVNTTVSSAFAYLPWMEGEMSYTWAPVWWQWSNPSREAKLKGWRHREACGWIYWHEHKCVSLCFSHWCPKEKSPLITWQRSTFLDQVLFSAIPVLLQWVPDGHGVSRKCYEEAPKHRILLPKGPATGESSVCLTLSFDAWRDHSTTWWWVDYIRPLSTSKEYQFVLTELKPVVNGICFPCPQCLSWACRVSDIPTWGPAQCQCKPRQQLTSCRTSDKLLTLSEPQLPHLKMKNLIIIVLVLMYMQALI